MPGAQSNNHCPTYPTRLEHEVHRSSLKQVRPVSEPTYPKSPSFFHRITISSSLFRSFSSPCTATFAIEPPSDSDRVPAAVYYTNLCVDCCTFNDYRAIISILRDFSIKSTSAASTSMSAFRILGRRRVLLPGVLVVNVYIGGADEVRKLYDSDNCLS
ncbi:hypothetical protein GmHk_11G031991 [Glycine max]|nr:hypothetical protein GmHk_11G031991 [Glycine max]